MRLIEHIISTIAPHECLGCSREGSLLCDHCAGGLPHIPSRCYRCHRLTQTFRTCGRCRSGSALYAVYVVTPYDGLAKELLWKIKYERAQDGGRTLAVKLQSIIPKEPLVIAHVPTAPSRVRARGYDQAKVMAREIAGALSAPHVSCLLRASHQRQVGQRRADRRRQMAQAFMLIREKDIRNKHVLLIDDVITTGSTLEGAATVLKAAGAARVSAAVFAAA